MSSLTAQLELLKEEQAILAEKIKQEEILNRKQELTLGKLEKLNEMQEEDIKKYHSRGKINGQLHFQTNIMTAPRFEVILETLKNKMNG